MLHWCTYKLRHAHTYTHAHTHIYSQALYCDTYIHTYTGILLWHPHIHTHTHTYTHIHTHTHTHRHSIVTPSSPSIFHSAPCALLCEHTRSADLAHSTALDSKHVLQPRNNLKRWVQNECLFASVWHRSKESKNDPNRWVQNECLFVSVWNMSLCECEIWVWNPLWVRNFSVSV